jgi:uncharacterized membrane protein YjjP (DUF1212 family)
LLTPELTIDKRSELLLAVARDLHVNGQETSETVRAIGDLGRVFALPATLFPRWGDLLLQTDDSAGKVRLSAVTAIPSGVAMNRVESIMRTIEDVCEGRATPSAMDARLALAEKQPPYSLLPFVLSCAVGATALALIFGAVNDRAVALIAISAAAGGILRRLLGRMGAGSILQAFIAALFAGFIGALAVRWNMSSSLRLVAVCPSMILVPGPHILNGSLDCISLRLSLGIARLTFAALIVVAICAGLLIGLGLGGASLPISEPGRDVALWIDTIAAGFSFGSRSRRRSGSSLHHRWHAPLATGSKVAPALCGNRFRIGGRAYPRYLSLSHDQWSCRSPEGSSFSYRSTTRPNHLRWDDGPSHPASDGAGPHSPKAAV